MNQKKRAEREIVNGIIARAYYIWRNDTVKRCRNRAELVVSLRELKTHLLDKIKARGFDGWLGYTTQLIDEKIAALVSDQPEATRKAALSAAPKPLIILPEPRGTRKTKPRPPPNPGRSGKP